MDESEEGAVPDLDRGHGTSVLCDSCEGQSWLLAFRLLFIVVIDSIFL